MSLPPVPTAVQDAAAKHDLGKIDWIQPEVVKNDKSSERGTYFFQYGMVIATGRFRLAVKVHPYSSITSLKWDLYVSAWKHPDDNSPRFQQIRVWHIGLAGGSTHTVEVPEPVKMHLGFVSTDASKAERRVWSSIIRWSRGDVGQGLEDTRQPIRLCDRLVARHNMLVVDGTGYGWRRVTNVYAFVLGEGFSPKRHQQTVKIVIEIKVPGEPTMPISPYLQAYVGNIPEPAATHITYEFSRDEFDLPLFYQLVRDMSLSERS